MKLDFDKYADGLIPAIVQDAETSRVLMLGFMNEDAIEATLSSGRVTFYSRAKGRLWTKGESSGNFLDLVSVTPDCDRDTLLIRAIPHGPVCHDGTATCFGPAENSGSRDFLAVLESTIKDRRSKPNDDSYVSSLHAKGLNRIAQKVGEEAVETAIAAVNSDDAAFRDEAADLLFHLLVLLNARGSSLDEVVEVLRSRDRSSLNDAPL